VEERERNIWLRTHDQQLADPWIDELNEPLSVLLMRLTAVGSESSDQKVRYAAAEVEGFLTEPAMELLDAAYVVGKPTCGDHMSHTLETIGSRKLRLERAAKEYNESRRDLNRSRLK